MKSKPVLKIVLVVGGLYVIAAAARTVAGVIAIKNATGKTPDNATTGEAFLNALSDPANLFNYKL